jgi:HlyD family secretion protein
MQIPSETNVPKQALRRLGAKLSGVAIFGVFVGLATLTVISGPQAEPAQRQEKIWPVSVMSVHPETIPPVLATYGRLESSQVANLKTTLSAAVVRVARLEGEWVEAGDLIIELDAGEASLVLDGARAALARSRAQLASAESEFRLARELSVHHQELAEFAEANLRRFQELHRRSMVSDSALDEVRQQASERAMVLARHLSSVSDFPNQIAQHQAAIGEAEARLRQAELDLQQTQIVAPFAGRVVNIAVAAGDRTAPGLSLAQVADYERLELRTSVSADTGVRLRQALQAGQHIRASAQYGNEIIEFELARLSGNIRSGQSGLDAFFRTPVNETLVIGTVMNLIISLPDEHEVVAVPLQAIYENNRVYRVENNRLVAIEVMRIGEYRDDQGNYRVLVRSPRLQPGDSLMTTQLPVAISGLLVAPVAALEDQADA